MITDARVLNLNAPVTLRVQRHEAGHVVAGWEVLGEDTIRGVTRVREGNRLGCASFNIDIERFYNRNTAVVASDVAVVYLTAIRLEPGNGRDLSADDDAAKVSGLLAEMVFRRFAQPGDTFAEFRAAWINTLQRRVDELLDTDRFWRGIYAVESAMDQLPTISGDGLRAVLAKVK